MQHFISLENLNIEVIRELIEDAISFKKRNAYPNLSNHYISNLFFENSTRTKLSFEMAEKKTGMGIIYFDAESSSIKKGETLYDTVKTLNSIGVECFVIRHWEDRFYENLISKFDVPIINAGDGCGDHPTQSLLDLITIQEEFGEFRDLNVVIVGDVVHSRVAHSDAKILQRLGANISFATPEFWRDSTMTMGRYTTIDEAIPKADVVMLLRNQNERHSQQYDEGNFLSLYGLTKERASNMKAHSIIMHPAPINRGVEIDEDLIESPKSRIFTQMTNGVFARISVLNYVFNS
ncbi:aspartate carbamoyltransferase catalytic subunit [Apibacter muscae]|uniref:aspartate carbamoyltransferase catalytic subunit n=1 Tax=Apibacter muscae TaxID=2509004 RepID=UPI0011ABC83E|nr:aspartate carbamoyltransferase catalytic subunit [Apibacter muscae]TWP25217.1 aspartate carbamoyltransferase catalytic subunit [Apibacter muscae]